LQAQAFEKLTIAVWRGMTELHLNLEMINAAGVVHHTVFFHGRGLQMVEKHGTTGTSKGVI